MFKKGNIRNYILMFDIKFENKGELFTYTTYNCICQADAEILWKTYVKKHFKGNCKIIKVVKVLKDLK